MWTQGNLVLESVSLLVRYMKFPTHHMQSNIEESLHETLWQAIQPPNHHEQLSDYSPDNIEIQFYDMNVSGTTKSHHIQEERWKEHQTSKHNLNVQAENLISYELTLQVSISKFAVFKSLWITSFWCKYSIPLQTSIANFNNCGSFNTRWFLCRYSYRLPLGMYSRNEINNDMNKSYGIIKLAEINNHVAFDATSTAINTRMSSKFHKIYQGWEIGNWFESSK